MKKFILTLFCASICCSFLIGQGISYGFKAGLNFSKFNGPSEKDNELNKLEEFQFNTGFHVGAAVIYKFTDLYGAKAEFMFSQKGGKINYDGPAFQDFPTTNEKYLRALGSRTALVNVSNSYIEIPLVVYGRVLPWLELSGGVNAAVLINSTATGEITFAGKTDFETPINTVFSLDYNYSRDEPVNFEEIDTEQYEYLPVDGVSLLIPRNSIGAYYDLDNKLGKVYKGIDFGVNAGVSFFINSSLFLGYRFNYGLVDITNNNADVERSSSANSGFTRRQDKDGNLSMQASIGFSF